MSTLEGTTMHPRCRHWVHVETYLNDFSSLAQVKIQFRIKKKTSQNSILIFFKVKLLCFFMFYYS